MNKEDKKIQEDLVNEMMKVSKTNPDVMIYMQSLMKCYEELEKEAKKLQSNWNSLKEDLRWEINDYNGNIDIETRNIDSEFLRGIAWEAQELLDKMNELEGVDNENN